MLSDEIKLIRVKSGLSQIDFSKEVGCSQRTISSWENGNRIPSYYKLIKLQEIAKKYKVKVALL